MVVQRVKGAWVPVNRHAAVSAHMRLFMASETRPGLTLNR